MMSLSLRRINLFDLCKSVFEKIEGASILPMIDSVMDFYGYGWIKRSLSAFEGACT